MLRNLGARAFGDRADYPVSATAVGLADLDDDGALDLIATSDVAGSQLVAVLRGNGRGGFGAPVISPAPYLVGPMVLADLDGDQHPDLALGTGRDLAVYVSRAGALTVPATFVVADQCLAAAAGDLDGDGRPDVVVAGYGGLTFLRNVSR